MNEGVGIGAALLAGLISFVSPCVLPMVPAYLSFVSGLSIDEMRNSGADTARRRRLLINCLAFVAGFSVVFIALGASASAVGVFLFRNKMLLARVAGVVIVLFGLNTLGLIKIPFLNYEKRFHQSRKAPGAAGSFVVGLAFAFGWTPCIGPILGAILGIASQQQRVWEGMLLLSVYSLGLGIPFVLAGLSVDRFFRLSSGVRKRFRVIEIVSGVLLIAIGLLIFFNMLGWLSSAVNQLLPGLGNIG
jgi:cytochrome c-type biogenesis protein